MDNKERKKRADKLLKILLESKVSASKLSKVIGVTYNPINDYFKGESTPHNLRLDQIEKYIIENNLDVNKSNPNKSGHIKVGNFFVKEKVFLQSLLKNANKLKKYEEYKIFESDLKRSGVIEHYKDLERPESPLSRVQ